MKHGCICVVRDLKKKAQSERIFRKTYIAFSSISQCTGTINTITILDIALIYVFSIYARKEIEKAIFY